MLSKTQQHRIMLTAFLFCSLILATIPFPRAAADDPAAAKVAAPAKNEATTKKPTEAAAANDSAVVPDARQVGGEPDGVVQVANLIYAGIKSSHCFSDHFLVEAEKDSAISTSRRFHAVKLSGAEIYSFPLLIMTGEGDFTLPSSEREALKRYVERGGFLLASASCSSVEWDKAFRREMAAVFPDQPLQALDLDHPIFHTVYEIKELQSKHGTPKPLEAVTLGGRVAVIYSQDGLNDTAHTQGCCCCGGNEIINCVQVNVNILAYALTY
ncbi:MAG: DUF4159 domain-containing protein [Planctomycetia bacterium]|nr:DUF4159 domain-containing protein [Planctomycetia bacterium]